MADGMLSLAWNNHSSTFSHMLTTLREMEKYTDATVACEGKFYGVHKLVLATCSDYFFKMFEQTPCKHPVVVLKDIGIKEIEALLSYMYDGVVSVAQSDLSKLISAAEILQIKGLAVPDEPPKPRKKVPHSQSTDDSGSPQPKRPRRETASSSNNSYSDKSSHRRSERIESKDSGNGKDNKEETVVLDQSDPVQESNDNEVQADEPEIETIDDDSDIKEEVSIENDDIQVNDFVLSPVTQDATVESNNIIKDLGNLEATVGFTSPTEQLFESQAWGNAQELSNQGFSMDAASLAGPSGSQPQQEQHLEDLRCSRNKRERRQSAVPGIDDEDWQCSFCSYIASSDDDLMAHLSTHNESFIEVRQSKGKKKFVCKICSYVNHTEYGVRVHLRSHTGEKPFACPMCPARFSQKCHMKCHFVRHTGEKPFQCSFCLVRFNRKSSLHRHVLSHKS